MQNAFPPKARHQSPPVEFGYRLSRRTKLDDLASPCGFDGFDGGGIGPQLCEVRPVRSSRFEDSHELRPKRLCRAVQVHRHEPENMPLNLSRLVMASPTVGCKSTPSVGQGEYASSCVRRYA